MDDGKIIYATSRFRPANPLGYDGDDPSLKGAAALPLCAGLATRVRVMIKAGARDETVDRYIEGWIESASTDPMSKLHRTLGKSSYIWSPKLDLRHRGVMVH